MSDALRRETEMSAMQIASVLADSLVEPLAEENFERLFNITHSAAALPDVTKILVYDRDGAVVHDGTREIAAYGTEAPDQVSGLVLRAGRTVSAFDDGALEIAVPILTGGRILGAVQLSISLERVQGHIGQLDHQLGAIHQASDAKHLRNFIGLSVVLALLGLLAGVLSAGRLIKPIDMLTAMTRQVAQGNFRVSAPPCRSDELRELGCSLKRMAAEIEESMISRSHLEKEVRSRTAALEHANRQLEERDSHRRRFLAEASHELRTPLTIIHGEAQTTARSKVDDIARYRKSLSTITEQSAAMCMLVDDLLKMARLDEHLTEYHFELLPVAELVDATVRSARKLAGSSALRIDHENRRDDLLVLGDRPRLGQLLLILVKNAINYSPKGGRIDICSDIRGDAAEIRIVDQGMGLEPLDRQRMFDPFYRGSRARRLFPEGSGLGLSIARKISDAHRATLRITGEADRGTTVSILLPLGTCPG